MNYCILYRCYQLQLQKNVYQSQKQKIPVAKRLRFTTDGDEGKAEGQQLDLQQLLNYIKQIPAILQADNEDIAPNVDDSTDLVSAYTRRDGVIVSLLKIQGKKQNADKYALKLIKALFIDKQDLQNVDVKKIDEDPRIKAIYGAIKQKFSFSEVEMSIISSPVHDSILSKRWNQGKTLKSKATLNESVATTSTPQDTNYNNNKQQGEANEQTSYLS
ncbi:unnamed protein product [Rotaria socialis]|uniref:Uncharacterized protein n=1 Tax=Rotaria socialis TaxID=392032 RepID=A0A818BFM3_9BILA|nr:unnamed protein product [Rotaria socialis]CAF4478599.1 unnamed protein product [Rotaria socialis]